MSEPTTKELQELADGLLVELAKAKNERDEARAQLTEANRLVEAQGKRIQADMAVRFAIQKLLSP